jgi:hypothetical protein
MICMARGGIRENTGPKTTKRTADESVKHVTERGLDELDALFDSMLEAAKGYLFVIHPDTQEKDFPRNADLVGRGEEVSKACKQCQKTGRTWLVFRSRPDLPMQKYLFDHLAGKAAQKAAEKVDPVINVYFGDIECEGEATPRTPEEPPVTPSTHAPEIGI